MKKIYAIFMVFIFSQVPVFSQGDSTTFENDQLIDLNGKILRGRIKGGENRTFFNVVEFYDQEGKLTIYSPSDIISFELTNRRYFKSVQLPELKEMVFAQVILSGELSLLMFRDDFYFEKGEKIVRLEIDKVNVDVNGSQRVFYKKSYLQVLNSVMGNTCGGELSSKIQKAQLKLNSLLGLFEEYHKCSGLPFQKHLKGFSLFDISWGIMAGMSTDSWHETKGGDSKSNYPYVVKEESQIKNKYYPHLMLLARMRNPMKSTRLFFDAGLGYVYESNEYRSKYEDEEQVIIGTDKYRSHTVYIPLSLNFAPYQRGGLSIYAGGGVNLGMSKFSREYDAHNRWEYDGEKPVKFASPNLKKGKTGMAFLFKLGSEGRASRGAKWIFEAQLTHSRRMYGSWYGSYNKLGFSGMFGVRF